MEDSPLSQRRLTGDTIERGREREGEGGREGGGEEKASEYGQEYKASPRR